MAKRVLVTGSSGFVGANLARRLISDGHDVHLLLRPNHEEWRLRDVESARHVVDVTDAEGVKQVVRGVRPEWIFHLAAYGAYSSQTGLLETVQTNLVGTANLVDAALSVGFEAFVNTGSSSEYGLKSHAAAETDLLEPNSDYALTKAAATMYCRNAARTYDVRLRTLRLYSVYGPWEEPARLIPTLIVYGLKGKLPKLADPDIARDYVHVEDACDAYLLAAADEKAENGAIFNVGTGVQTSLAQVVQTAREVMPIKEKPAWGSMPNRKWDTTTWVADNRAISQTLGWKPRYQFQEGLEQVINWFRADLAMRAYYEREIGLAQPLTVKSTGSNS
jgi:nucleoside-diphosphate-sugar epimerase